MDSHPTPYPGKDRRAASSITKAKAKGKTSKDPGVVSTRYKQYPQRRVFGTIRSTNVTLEDPLQKPQAVKASKPLRPSITSVKAVGRDGSHKVEVKKAAESGTKDSNQKVASKKKATDSGGKGSNHKVDSKKATGSGSKDSRKPNKSAIRKTSAVSFREPLLVEDEPCSPVPTSIKPLVLGTPYLSAQNCSKCRLDKLESASYWISQIKLAESVGKHFVSATFFRLAFECHAEPSRRLRSELKSYKERHVLASNVWPDVYLLYGLAEGKCDDGTGRGFTEAVPCTDFGSLDCSSGGVICEDHKDQCLGFSVGDIVLEEENPANPDPDVPEQKEDVQIDPFADAVNISAPALSEDEKLISDPGVQELKEHVESELFADASNSSTLFVSEVEGAVNAEPEAEVPKEHVESEPFADHISSLLVYGEEKTVSTNPDFQELKDYVESEPSSGASNISSLVISEEEKPACSDPEVHELRESAENESLAEAANKIENEDRSVNIPNSIDGSPSIYKSCDALPASHRDEVNTSKSRSSKVKLHYKKACRVVAHSSDGSSSSSAFKKHGSGGIASKEAMMSHRNKFMARPKSQIGEPTEKSRLGPKSGVEGKKQRKLYANKDAML